MLQLNIDDVKHFLLSKIVTAFSQLPEEDELFTVNLTNPTNGAALGNSTLAQLIIVKNDDSIYFKGQ